MKSAEDFLSEVSHTEEFAPLGVLPPKSAAEGRSILDRGKPLVTARKFLAEKHREGSLPTLFRQDKTFFSWTGSHYAEIQDDDVRSELYAYLEKAFCKTPRDGVVLYNPKKNNVGNIMDALHAAVNLPAKVRAPAWLDGRDRPAPSDVIACTNGLLDARTLQLLPATPLFFSRNALSFPYDENAAEPTEWLAFLDAIWPEDQGAIACLQEIFGYLLTGDTRHQKAFLVIGPKRSGKGTVGRVLTRLLGEVNVVNPTLGQFATNFGLAPLIGKRLAIISDARLGGRADDQAIAERILTITGEDSVTIDRKHKTAWTGRLETRFLIMSNELPRLSDSSGALASRFVVLTMTRSFYGNEDMDLGDRLLAELPGILNWALVGLKRLHDRGHFLQPISSSEVQQELADLGSPVGTFIRDTCEVAPGRRVPVDELFERWRLWCTAQGREHPGTAQNLGRALRSVVPALKVIQPRCESGRQRMYEGVGLRY
jgi:putative DNA primase/helicase